MGTKTRHIGLQVGFEVVDRAVVTTGKRFIRLADGFEVGRSEGLGVERTTRSQWITATSAHGRACAVSSGELMTTCLWLPASLAFSGASWRRATKPVSEDDAKTESDQPGRPSAAKKSQSTVLVERAIDVGVEFFHDDEAFVLCPLPTWRATYRVRSKNFKLYLARLYYQRTGKAASAEALQGAITLCESIGRFDGEQQHVFTRVGEHGGKIYLDLCDHQWRAVEMPRDGWRVLSDPPVRFPRARGMLTLPTPDPGGHLDELRNVINIATDDDYLLIRAWLVGALRPRGPYPVLDVHGEHGSAKSMSSRLLRNLIDPNVAALRAEPRDAHDLIIAATNGWIIALDNVSHLPVWLSDALCRLATGGGFGTRELHTDAEEVLFDERGDWTGTATDLLKLLYARVSGPAPRRCRMTDHFEAFAAAVESRLQQGAKTYGDRSFRQAPDVLAGEVEQELLECVRVELHPLVPHPRTAGTVVTVQGAAVKAKLITPAAVPTLVKPRMLDDVTALVPELRGHPGVTHAKRTAEKANAHKA